MKYGYFLDDPDPSEVTSFADLGIRGAGGAVKSDSVPASVGDIVERLVNEGEE